jgi:glycogen synthase
MRIMMLGWEFPPFIAGGLGTACYGLTKALDRLGHEVVFVLPKPVDRSQSSHVQMLSPEAIRSLNWTPPGAGQAGSGGAAAARILAISPESAGAASMMGATQYTMEGFAHTVFRAIPHEVTSPYPAFTKAKRRAMGPGGEVELDDAASGDGDDVFADMPPMRLQELQSLYPGLDAYAASAIARAMDYEAGVSSRNNGPVRPGHAGAAYEGDMVANAERYARLVVALSRGERFDVIHAHDWMTFPAGLALAQVTGKPLVVHVHSTEFDRSGDHVNQRVYDIERRGMHGAARVVCVSNLTQSICVRRYGIHLDRTDVVYNGIETEAHQPLEGDRIESTDRIVLFLGRITMQKGPEYFVRAAKRVLEKMPNVKFVVAGSGDMTTRMIEEAAHYGIGHRVLFTGFVRGKQVDEVFRMADCYVMPSVSEPFGIAPLEAMRNDVPVIISKQSGVSEVLTHALKVDFWDIDEMANKVVAVLRHPPLSQTLREHGTFELRRLTWDGAASKCVQSYGRAIGMVTGVRA